MALSLKALSSLSLSLSRLERMVISDLSLSLISALSCMTLLGGGGGGRGRHLKEGGQILSLLADKEKRTGSWFRRKNSAVPSSCQFVFLCRCLEVKRVDWQINLISKSFFEEVVSREKVHNQVESLHPQVGVSREKRTPRNEWLRSQRPGSTDLGHRATAGASPDAVMTPPDTYQVLATEPPDAVMTPRRTQDSHKRLRHHITQLSDNT